MLVGIILKRISPSNAFDYLCWLELVMRTTTQLLLREVTVINKVTLINMQ